MADTLQELANWDIFFYYGLSDLDLESRFDLFQILIEEKRSLYYNRQESAGITEYENNPNSLNLQINAKYDIASAIAYRNTIVTTGANNTTDRRIAISQNSIGFEVTGENLDIKVLYFLYADYEQPKSNSFPLVR